MSEQSVSELQALVERGRAGEAALRERLREMNQARGRVAEQLQALQQAYDKKLRGLEQRLEGLRTHSDALQRQNALYRTEIDTYQARLLDKEKIIAALLAQRREPLNSSDPSKSDRTDSNTDDPKAFKKHPEERTNHLPAPPQPQPAPHTPSNVSPLPSKTDLPPKLEPADAKQLEETKHVEAPAQVEASRHVPPPPPPSRAKPKGKNKKSPVQPRKFEAMLVDEPAVDGGNFFSHLAAQAQEEQLPLENAVAEPEQLQPADQAEPGPQPHPHPHQQEQAYAQHEQPQQPAYQQFQQEQEQYEQHYEQQYEEQQQEQHYEEQQYEQQQEQQYEQQQEQQYEQEQLEEQCGHEEPSEDQGQPYEEQQYPQPQVEEPQQEYQHMLGEAAEPEDQPEEDNSNFLSHFTNTATHQDYFEPVSRKAKPAKQSQAKPQQPDNNDFFAQLSKGEHHQLEHIEESSIDHIERDSSVLSSEQPYFADPPKRAPPRMSKKVLLPASQKKREQIKMMDPSCFD